jgi:hypothetical protein
VSERIGELKRHMDVAGVALTKIESYTCVIHCHERLKGKVHKPESIFSRFKKPSSVYLRWQKGPYEGLQASHLPQRDGPDKFQARESGLKGLAGALTFPHSAPLIEAAYPHHFRTHETSVLHLMQLSTEIQQKAEALGKLTVVEIGEVQDQFLKRPATKIVCELSPDRQDGLRWQKTEFYMDRETKLPLHFKLYDFDGELSGEYAFTEFKPNAPLTDDDFALKRL